VRIQAAQAKYPGYGGMYLQPPTDGKADATWTTLVRYDTAEHLEAWMASPERAAMLQEAEAFVDNVELVRLATAFPGWVPVDPATGKGPPDWKTALLVLLGLFPIVMLELRYFNPVASAWAWNTSFATLISCAIGVAATSFVTMPLLVRWFHWWLFPQHPSGRTTLAGSLMMVALFAGQVAALWWLVP
jgi:antibiotic biosynthesis monooxygenase (ABM) superfamily enzyme